MTCEPWPVVWPCDTDEYDPALVDAALSAATSILWGMSGRRYGLCATTESYRLNCSDPCLNPYGDEFGPGVDWRLGNTRRWCCRIHLAQRPVRSIDSVTVLGDLLDPAEYALERDTLFRIGACWPCERECDDPPVQVTYSWGVDVPPLGQMAVGELACELLAGWTNADCRLPSNAVSITRQGVTVDLGDPQVLFEQNRIGLPISDAFIRMANPNRLMDKSQVWSPDLARRSR